jgi:hypothetical protein
MMSDQKCNFRLMLSKRAEFENGQRAINSLATGYGEKGSLTSRLL